MRKFTRNFVITLVVAGFLLLSGCAKEGQNVAADKSPAVSKSAAASAAGLYEDKALGITFKYPGSAVPVVNEPITKYGEVLNREGTQKVPAIVLRITDIEEGVALENIGKALKKSFKRNYPSSKRFKVAETTMIKLESGMDACLTIITWKYQGSVPVLTVFVSAYKDGKVIESVVTSVPGQPPVEILEKWAKGLNVTL